MAPSPTSHVRKTTPFLIVPVCGRTVSEPPPPSFSRLWDISPTTSDPALFPAPVKERDEKRDVSHQRQRPRDISATTSLPASVPVSCCYSRGGIVGKTHSGSSSGVETCFNSCGVYQSGNHSGARMNCLQVYSAQVQQVPGCPSQVTKIRVMEALNLEINVERNRVFERESNTEIGRNNQHLQFGSWKDGFNWNRRSDGESI